MHSMHDSYMHDVGMYHVKEQEIGSFGRLDGKSCTNCREPFYSIFSCNMCPLCNIEKKTIVNSTGKYVGRLYCR